jgi:phosphoglycerol transferase MdoB-like AlkP superfamily enzyme
MSDLLLYTLIVAAVLNVVASLLIRRRTEFTSFQKRAQLLLVWLLPFIASIGILVFYRSMDDKTHRKPSGDTPDIGSAMGGGP